MGSHFVDKAKEDYNARFPIGTRREGIETLVGTSIGEIVCKPAGNVIGITARGMAGNA